MSIARSFLLLSAGIALGGAGVMVVNGDIDLSHQIDAYRAVDRSTRLAAPARTPVPAPSAVALRPPAVEPATEAVVVTLPSVSAPPAPPRTRPAAGDRLSLAQDLQSELQRVGCYAGTIDGIWTPLSQKAMRGFMDRVNAQLPVEEPDYVLLALVRGRQGTVCAKPCSPIADGCVVTKPAPDRAPAAISRTTIAPNPSRPADARLIPVGQDNRASPAAANPQAPGQIVSAPGTTPSVAAQQKKKAAAQKQDPGIFGLNPFKLFLSNN